MRRAPGPSGDEIALEAATTTLRDLLDGKPEALHPGDHRIRRYIIGVPTGAECACGWRYVPINTAQRVTKGNDRRDALIADEIIHAAADALYHVQTAPPRPPIRPRWW